ASRGAVALGDRVDRANVDAVEAERSPWDEGDPALFAPAQHVHRAPIAQVEAVLHRGDRDDPEGAFELVDVEIADADEADLPFVAKPRQLLEGALDRHLRIGRVELVEVDAVQPQASEAAFASAAQVG